jgi:predicted metal-dependent hydrolase
VQLDLPFLRAPAPDETGSAPVVHFVRMRRARRYIIRVRPDGSVRVTVPRGGSRAEAVRFLRDQNAWIARERARVQATAVTPAWTAGVTMMVGGELVTIHAAPEAPGRQRVQYGPRSFVASDSVIDLRALIEADLRAFAREDLSARLHALAEQYQLRVRRVTIRNQRSRWGSCTAAGDIALNYRLVQMPPSVRDYVLLHELMHLKEQNHSRRFWRLVEAVCPRFREAERWLRLHGRGLM